MLEILIVSPAASQPAAYYIDLEEEENNARQVVTTFRKTANFIFYLKLVLLSRDFFGWS